MPASCLILFHLTAEAGNNRIVISGARITLDGSSSIEASDYLWKVIQGDGVLIKNSNNARTNVFFPVVTSKKIVRFELVVTDESGNKASDMVEYYVVPMGLPDITILLNQLIQGGESGLNIGSHDLDKDGRVGIKDAVLYLQSSASMR